MKTRYAEARHRSGWDHSVPKILSCHISIDEDTWKVICHFFNLTYISQIIETTLPPAYVVTQSNKELFVYILTLSSRSFDKEFNQSEI